MNKFKQFESIIDSFQKQVEQWIGQNSGLAQAIEDLNIKEQKKSVYKVENSVVFNRNLRKIRELGPKYILVADNPGMDEQKNENLCYLIGKAGKVARNFFENNGLVTDFESEVAVLNKTCIHTHSTADLKKLKEYKELISETQRFMADIAIDIQMIYGSKLWITGCSELHEKGLFAQYLSRLNERHSTDAWHLKDKAYFYPHFSYGNFQKKINAVKNADPQLTFPEALKKAGRN